MASVFMSSTTEMTHETMKYDTIETLPKPYDAKDFIINFEYILESNSGKDIG